MLISRKIDPSMMSTTCSPVKKLCAVMLAHGLIPESVGSILISNRTRLRSSDEVELVRKDTASRRSRLVERNEFCDELSDRCFQCLKFFIRY